MMVFPIIGFLMIAVALYIMMFRVHFHPAFVVRANNIARVVSIAFGFGLLVNVVVIYFDKSLAIDLGKVVWVSQNYPLVCFYALVFPGWIILPILDKVLRR